MAITEEARHHLYLQLESTLGREDANVLMEHLPPVGWADVATKTDLDHLRLALSRDIGVADVRLGVMEAGLRKDIGAADVRLGVMEAGLRKDIENVQIRLSKEIENSELRVRNEMGEKFNRLLFQILASQGAFVGLVLVLTRLIK